MSAIPAVPVVTTKKLPPWVIGALRGVAGGAIISAIGALIVTLGGVRTGTLAPFAPIAVLALRGLEGWIDQMRAK